MGVKYSGAELIIQSRTSDFRRAICDPSKHEGANCEEPKFGGRVWEFAENPNY